MFGSISQLILLIIALSADAFAASFAYGADKVKIPPLSAIIVALISDLLLMASLLAGSLLKTYIPAGLTVLFSFTILFVLGAIKLFDSSIRKKIRENRFSSKEVQVKTKNLRFILTVYATPEAANTEDVEILSPAEAFSLGLALSLDSAAAGFGAASGEYSFPLAALLAFLISLCAVSGGCRLGRLLAAKSNFNFSIIGGILLLLLAFSKL